MAAFDDITKQHSVNTPIQDPEESIDDLDQDQIDGGEINSDLDKIHEEAFGDTDNLPIDKEVNKDEIKRIKDLTKKQQKKK